MLREKVGSSELLKLISSKAKSFEPDELPSVDISSKQAVNGNLLILKDLDVSEQVSVSEIIENIRSRDFKEWDGILFVNCAFSSFSTEGNTSVNGVNYIENLGFHCCNFQKLSLVNQYVKILAILDSNIKELTLGTIHSSYVYFHGLSHSIEKTFSSHPSLNKKIIISSRMDFYGINFDGVFYVPNLSFAKSLHFRKCSFKRSPSFVGTDIPVETEFTSCKFSDFSAPSIIDYRFLKTIFNQHENSHMSDMFASYEMQAWAKNGDLDLSEKTIAFFYSIFSDFGRSLSQAILFYILILAVFANIFILGDILVGNILSIHSERDLSAWLYNVIQWENDSLKKHLLILLLTLKMWLGPFGLTINFEGITFCNTLFAFLGWLLQLGSSVMIFLILLMLRRRFRLN
jgi:hypothetical protein